MPKLGVTTQKMLLLLLGGVALGLSGSPRKYSRALKDISKEWQKLNRRALYAAIRKLYESKLIRLTEQKDGTIEVVLSRQGERVALRYKLDEMKIPNQARWDKKWRVILFDIPEEQKQLRDTLRMRLKQFGLRELQKSVFIHPYECRNEIDFVIELYGARRYVRFLEAYHIDNELHLKEKFGLL